MGDADMLRKWLKRLIVFMNSAPTRIDFKVVNLAALCKRLNALAEI